MSYLESFRLRVGADNTSMRERKVRDARSRAIKHFDEDPSFFIVNALEPEGEEIIQKRLRVVNESVLKQINPERVYSKYIVPHPEEHMLAGTMLFGLYGVDWLVTAVTGLGDVTQQGMLQKLNETITVKFPDGDQVIPAVLNEVSRLGAGVLETNFAMMPNRLVKMRVPENELTRNIGVNTRFKATNSMFTVMKRDLATDENVINWIAREDLEEHGDDTPTPPIEEGIIQGEDTITRARNYGYSAPRPGVKTWEIRGTDIVRVLEEESDEMTTIIRADRTELITFQLVAIYPDGSEVVKDIRLVSLL